ncbi:MAG: nucleoside hydrolase [Anaerolineae bacterium]|nr:nucleoside hydrolase [Anaerolineae bacterium]
MPQKIIIDTDPGVDDAMAILFALKAPELELVGLTTIYGNVHTDLATQNALRLLEVAGRPDIPVAHGANLPLVLPFDHPAAQVHGADGFGNTNQPPPHGKPIDPSAAQFIVETVMAHPGQVTLVPIGPLTNLALALALEPRLVGAVAGVVLMGGAALVNGNVTPAAEANIYKDPHAADVVFTAGWPLTMVGLDVTTKTVMTPDDIAGLKSAGTKATDFIEAISHFYMAYYRQAFHGLHGMHLHDPSAVAYVIDPSLFTTLPTPIRVITDGIAAGLTFADRRQQWEIPNGWTDQPPTNICIDVDSPRLLNLYRTYMTRPD